MSTRNKWTPETILATLEPIVAELGRFPKRDELSARGLGGLNTAMGKHGGVAEWRARFAGAAPVAVETVEVVEVVEVADVVETVAVVEVVEVSHDAIAERAYYLALEEEGGDPVVHWLTAERELAAA